MSDEVQIRKFHFLTSAYMSMYMNKQDKKKGFLVKWDEFLLPNT